MQLPNSLVSLTDVLVKLPQQQIAKTISGVLLIYIAYLASQATWMFVPSGQISSQSVKTSKNMQSNKDETVSISKLEKLHLFGVYNASPSVKTIEIEDAPETRLNLTLSAAVASDDISASAAIIENNGRQETYGIGDVITGTKATLEQVLTNRVIIKQSGRMETLMLDGIDYKKLSTSVPNQIKKQEQQKENASTVIDMRQNKQLSKEASNLKADLFKDPGKITDYLKIVPKRSGGDILGYRLMPGKNSEFFNRSGLKSGDVAVQMNGFDLTVPSEAAQAMMALRQENQVSLLVKREDNMTEILFSIDN
ncbi:MAG: general secretion pathway protein C [Alteromonadaceae bacterium]|jgi:general secretion pathway protein C|tara:strand:- start:14779 stop:15705 length:927 start_codon:yes stop_codon:yes gene_type:complete